MTSARREMRKAKEAAQVARYKAEAAAYGAITNSYKGGVPNRLSESYPMQEGFRFTSSAERSQLIGARDRAYQAYRNNLIAKTLVNTEGSNVIGDGLNFQPNSKTPAWNDEAVERYYKWLENCSVRGPDMHDGCSLERMIWQQSRIAGDVGWIQISDNADSRIQIVPGENISTPDGMKFDPAVYEGIRFDPRGAPLIYYVLSQSERGGARKWFEVFYRDFRFLPHYTLSNQVRGESCYIEIFDLLSQLDRYIDGVALAAWMATVFGIIFKQKGGQKELLSLPTLTDSQGDQRKAITFENGMVKYVGTDDEVGQVQAHQPMSQTPDFVTMMLRLIGQPFDMPLEVIGKDMSHCNFASARIGLLQFYRSCRLKAAKFASRWGRTLFWWLSREAQRANDDPKKWKTAFPEDYGNFDLIVNAWDYTDPVSEAQADLLEMTMLTKSPQMVIQERGRNAQQILKQWEEWASKRGNLPQVLSNMTRDPTPEPTEAPVDPNAPDPELERIKAEADAYGVGVRAGVITPQTDDEEDFRQKLELPAMSADAKRAWKDDKGVRRPITLTQPGGQPAPSRFGQPAVPDEGADKSGNGDGQPTE